jgi:hypothetical protein
MCCSADPSSASLLVNEDRLAQPQEAEPQKGHRHVCISPHPGSDSRIGGSIRLLVFAAMLLLGVSSVAAWTPTPPAAA